MMAWTFNDLTRIPDGNGFRYFLQGRPFNQCIRCCGCGEHGVFIDTELCDDCEAARAATRRAALEEALAAVEAEARIPNAHRDDQEQAVYGWAVADCAAAVRRLLE